MSTSRIPRCESQKRAEHVADFRGVVAGASQRAVLYQGIEKAVGLEELGEVGHLAHAADRGVEILGNLRLAGERLHRLGLDLA